MKKGFTLVELVFVIVIIGILSAVAVPKFANLKQNAEVSNMIKFYTVVQNDLPSAYLNEVELNGNKIDDLSQIMKITPIHDAAGKGWYKQGYYYYYYTDPATYMRFRYLNGRVEIYTRAVNGTKYRTMLEKKLGLIFDGDTNVTWVDLNS